MKILIIQGAFLPIPPVLGGAVEKMWYGLAKEFVSQGHEVKYISKKYKNQPKLESNDGIEHIRIKGYETPSSLIILKILDLFYTIRALFKIHQNMDVIVSNTFWLPILLSSKLKKKCLIDVARIPKGQIKFYVKNARLRANSNVVSKAICEELNFKYCNKIVMIPNTLPFKHTDQFNFLNKKKYILYTGRLHPEKGLDLLIESFKLLKNKDWKLLVVGPYSFAEGGGGDSYLNYLKTISKGSNVLFKGPIYKPELLNTIYSECSIFVYPSLAERGETFGVSPLEAMSCGCATIVSNLECFRDFLIPNKNGLIFDHRAQNRIEILSNQLAILIDNPLLMKSLAVEALKVNQSHSNEVIAKEFIKEFENIISFNNKILKNESKNIFSKK